MDHGVHFDAIRSTRQRNQHRPFKSFDRQHRFDLRGKPKDANDHAISALRLLVMRRPSAAQRVRPRKMNPIWAEFAEQLQREDGAEVPIIGAGRNGALLVPSGGTIDA